MKTDTVKAGDVLYDVHSTQMGNTTMRRMGVWHVKIIERKDGGFVASWNGNGPEWMPAWRVARYRRSPPEWLRTDLRGGRRCHLCGRREDEGHSDACTHPRAISKRKKGAVR